MPIPPGRRLLPRAPAVAAFAVLALISACSSAQPNPSTPAPSASGLAASPVATPTPSATPLPTPRFTNSPDPQLSDLIPGTLRGAKVNKAPSATFGLTPGDMGEMFGDLGLRFQSLALAYIEQPRLSLYAVQVGAPRVTNAELRRYLGAAGEYLGVHGLHPEAWKSAVVGGHQVWTRGDDTATLPGTTFYCWSAGQYVFLITGSSDTQNRAMVAALPGLPPPKSSPRPSGSPAASASGGASSSAAPSASASTTSSSS